MSHQHTATRVRLAPPHRFLLACGIVLIISGLVHGIILVVTGGSFDGPVSWRKPFVFGLSFGITSVTMALIATTLRLRRSTAWMVLGALGGSSVLETALITIQTWRVSPPISISPPLWMSASSSPWECW